MTQLMLQIVLRYNIENKEYNIFKAAESEDYMVCIFDDENSYNSDVFHTINDSHCL